jgi:hypothetical protein
MSSQSYIFNPTERTLAASGDGFAPPRMTTADRLAITFGPNDRGMFVYDTTLSTFYWWSGVAWVGFPSTGYSEGTFSANFLTTTGTITLANPVNNARWSRIGNVVSITGKFTVQSINLPTGELEIDNLPFPVLPGQESAATVAVTGLNNGARTSIMAYMNGSGVVVRNYDSGTMLQMGVHVLAGSVWYLAGTYFTT